VRERWQSFPDLSWSERLVLFPAIGLFFVLGVYPQVLVGIFNRTTMQMVESFGY
jgi:NADH:ubiquinone oxidoreductase subunit 4 (subunit M)